MTSELKPCPFCGGEAEIERYGRTKISTAYRCQDCGCSLETSETFNHGREWNTRATPSENMGLGGSCETTELLNDLRFRLENMTPDDGTDEELINRIIKCVDQLSATPSADPLAGLVRYDVSALWGRTISSVGEYVLHSEVAKIIEALDNRACIAEYRFKNAINFVQPLLMRRAETAEAKLAKYEDQLPIGYITPKAQLSLLQEFSTSDSISPVKMGECRIAIYDSPAPVSGSLKAEIEEIRGQAMRIIVAFDPDNDLDNPEKFNAYFDLKAALNVEASNDKG